MTSFFLQDETIKHEYNTLWPCIHETFECCLSRMGASVGSFQSYFLVMVCKVEQKWDFKYGIEIANTFLNSIEIIE